MTEEATVELEIGVGDDKAIYQLRPLLSAMRILNRYAGGYVGMFRALQNFDADAMVTCIAAGTGANGKQVQVIEKRLYATGFEKLQAPLVRFVTICANGGRDPEDAPKVDGEAAPGND